MPWMLIRELLDQVISSLLMCSEVQTEIKNEHKCILSFRIEIEMVLKPTDYTSKAAPWSPR